jgi:peroxiredoxin
MMRKGFLLVLYLCCTLQSAVASAERLPDLQLRTLAGEPATLEGYLGQGKWVLVMFWALECPVCEENKPDIVRFHERHHQRDAEVVGVVIDGMAQQAAIRERLRREPVPFPNFVAELPQLAEAFQAAAGEPFRGTPTYWFFAPDGELKAVNPGRVRLKALEAYLARYTGKY